MLKDIEQQLIGCAVNYYDTDTYVKYVNLMFRFIILENGSFVPFTDHQLRFYISDENDDTESLQDRILKLKQSNYKSNLVSNENINEYSKFVCDNNDSYERNIKTFYAKVERFFSSLINSEVKYKCECGTFYAKIEDVITTEIKSEITNIKTHEMKMNANNIFILLSIDKKYHPITSSKIKFVIDDKDCNVDDLIEIFKRT